VAKIRKSKRVPENCEEENLKESFIEKKGSQVPKFLMSEDGL